MAKTLHCLPVIFAGTVRAGISVCIIVWLSAAQAYAADVRMAISSTPLSAPFIIAIENGYFTQQGVKPIPTLYQGGHRTISAVFAGDADIATSSEAVVMFNAFKRNDFRVLATFVSSDNDNKILAPVDRNIKSIGDLRGRKIGTIRNAAAHFFLSQTLQLAGVPDSAVTIIGIDPEKADIALESHEVDAVAVWEPYGYLLSAKYGAQILALPHGRAYMETFNALATADYISQNSDSADAVLRGLIQAINFINTHPERAQSIVASFLKQDLASVKAVWLGLRFKVGLDQWLITTLETEATWAKKEKLVDPGTSPNFLDFLALRPLDRVNSAAITIYR